MNPASSNPRNYNNSSSNIRRRFTYRFLRTLKQVNSITAGRSSSSWSSRRRRSLEIKHAANMCMAATVGGTRAWSRAMLSKIRRRRRRRRCSINETCWTGELREIVPGGEDLDTRSLLDETAHYIKCLTTQVQVMNDILRLYSSSSSS
ncbi:hypothetical protein ACET3Z_004599 [Daucus carota]